MHSVQSRARAGLAIAIALTVPLLAVVGCSSSSSRNPTPTTSPTPILSFEEDGRGNFHGVPQIAGGELTKLPDGLQYLDLHLGTGDTPSEDQVVTVRWNGFLRTGGSFTAGQRTMVFPLRRNATLPGVYEALLTMRPGGARRVVIPPELGYGADGLQTRGGAILTIVPPNTTLVVDLELVSIAPATEIPGPTKGASS